MALWLHVQCQTLGHGFHSSQPSSPRRALPGNRIGVAPRSRRRSAATLPRAAFPSRTQRIIERISTCDEVGGAGGSSSYEALKKLDQLWSNICATPPDKREICEVISQISGPFYSEVDKNNSKCTFHVVVCGGTLGIFIATALVSRGLRVGIVERNQLKGREQEWNISGKELMELVHVGILTKSDIEQISMSKFNPNRCGFEKKGEIWVEDILNLGVSILREAKPEPHTGGNWTIPLEQVLSAYP